MDERLQHVKIGEIQDEAERDNSNRFIIEQYKSNGYTSHSHRNMEIYGVVYGCVKVAISNVENILHDGQIAIIQNMQTHNYKIDGEAEVFYAHIGTMFMREFSLAYPGQCLPMFLMDVKYNQSVIFSHIKKLSNKDNSKMSYLSKLVWVYELLNYIVEHYGVEQVERVDANNKNVVSVIIQYIYDHYKEKITLDSLSKIFFISKKTLSKKFAREIGVDLRVFINDIRARKAIQFLMQPENKDKSVEQIVYECGFQSITTFYRSYERVYKTKFNRSGI